MRHQEATAEPHDIANAHRRRPAQRATPTARLTRRNQARAQQSITVLVADPQPIVRIAVATHLDEHPDIRVTRHLHSPAAALDESLRLSPDVIVIDPEPDLTHAANAVPLPPVAPLLARFHRTRLVIFSAFRHDRHLQAAINSHASALVSKLDEPDAVPQAVIAASAGKRYISERLHHRLVPDRLAHAGTLELKPRAAALTAREHEVLTYIANGMSKKEIATVMHLAVKTIDNHTTNLMRKLDIHDRVQLARYAIREGLAHC